MTTVYYPFASVYLPDKAKANSKSSSSGLKVQQRVAYGREVEVKHTSDANGGHSGLQKRTPSLDDVLNQIRGEFFRLKN
jgi:hypothetical protein